MSYKEGVLGKQCNVLFMSLKMRTSLVLQSIFNLMKEKAAREETIKTLRNSVASPTRQCRNAKAEDRCFSSRVQEAKHKNFAQENELLEDKVQMFEKTNACFAEYKNDVINSSNDM
ncbi:MAG: hypothetical protein LBU33_02350 [Endomicrobium sp.]|nr:hypothetical protein [Endomicrobium sp.]